MFPRFLSHLVVCFQASSESEWSIEVNKTMIWYLDHTLQHLKDKRTNFVTSLLLRLWEAEIVVFWHREFGIKWLQNLLTTPLWSTIEWAWDIIEQRSGYVESSTRVGLSNAHQIIHSRHVVAEQWPHHLHLNFEVAFRFKKKPPLSSRPPSFRVEKRWNRA